MPPEKKTDAEMPLVIDAATLAFNKDSVKKGDLIRAQYRNWPEPRNGLVSAVSSDKLTVLFLPGLGNVSNYFPIKVQEVADGAWSIWWSSDLETIRAVGGES